ncbi:MAG: hypothetical protein ACHQWU_07280, partial [Gemmatimonadales bacterium]
YTQSTGVPTNAETISYWLSKDSTSASSNEYILFRRANAQPPRVVAKGIIVNPTDTVFQYFRPDSTNALQPIPIASLPLTHPAAMHGAASDTGKRAWIDSVRTVKVTLKSVYHDPRTGVDAIRTLSSTIHLMNAGLIHRSTCGQPPIGVAVTATFVPADGIIVQQPYVKVAWTPSIDDGGGENDVQRYAIYRRLSSVTDFDEPLTSVPAGQATYSFADTDIQSGQTWVYGVAAQDCTPTSSTIGTATAVTIP